MGSVDARAYPADGEGPIHVVELSPFRIDAVTVSTTRFAEFVEATGHVTEAERFGWSFVFAGFLPDDFPDTRGSSARSGGGRSKAPTGGIPRVRSPTSTAAMTIPSSTCRGTTPRRSARGAGRDCRPRPSGSSPPAAVCAGWRSRGATSSSPMAGTG